MNSTNRVLLLVFLVFLTAVFIWENPFRRDAYERTETSVISLFAGFDPYKAARVEITKPGGEEKVVLEKRKTEEQEEWILSSLHGYLANQKRVNDLFATIGRLQSYDLLEDAAENFDEPYQVGPDTGTRVQITNEDGVLVVDFYQGAVVGDFNDPQFRRRQMKFPAYVRKSNEKRIYQVYNFFPVESSSSRWADSTLARFDASKVSRIELEGSKVGDQKIVIVKEGQDWKLLNPKPMPAQKEAVEAMIRSFSSLVFQDLVGKKDDLAAYGLDAPALKVRMKLDDGQEYSLEVGKVMEDRSYYATKGETDSFVYKIHYLSVDTIGKTPEELSQPEKKPEESSDEENSKLGDSDRETPQ